LIFLAARVLGYGDRVVWVGDPMLQDSVHRKIKEEFPNRIEKDG
jgi:hypothetical protein